jgi:hypothetical protein
MLGLTRSSAAAVAIFSLVVTYIAVKLFVGGELQETSFFCCCCFSDPPVLFAWELSACQRSAARREQATASQPRTTHTHTHTISPSPGPSRFALRSWLDVTPRGPLSSQVRIQRPVFRPASKQTSAPCEFSKLIPCRPFWRGQEHRHETTARRLPRVS